MKKLEKPYQWENMEEDFTPPYKNIGKFDKEVLKSRYMNLTNAPRQLLQQRFTTEQW